MIIFDAVKTIARALLTKPKIDRDRERWAVDGATEKSPLEAMSRVSGEMRAMDERIARRRVWGCWWRR